MKMKKIFICNCNRDNYKKVRYQHKCPNCGGNLEITYFSNAYGVRIDYKCSNCGKEYYIDTRKSWEHHN